jgi:hypothetical protein
MRRWQEQHNTPDEVEEWVKQAIGIIEYLDVPDDLRMPAFTGALSLLSAKQLFFEQPTFSGHGLAIPRGA